MKYSHFIWRILIISLMILPLHGHASDLIMRRLAMDFPEAMTALQSSITQQGYRVSRVQRVDIGLTSSGYDTAEYRIVFFTRPEQLDMIEKEHPHLVAFMPLKITIFAEGDDTILVTLNPRKLNEFFPEAGLADLFSSWEADIKTIFDQIQSEH